MKRDRLRAKVPGSAPALGRTATRPRGAIGKNPAKGRSNLTMSGAGRTRRHPRPPARRAYGSESGRAPRDRALPRHFPKIQMREDIGIRSWQHQPLSKPVPGSATQRALIPPQSHNFTSTIATKHLCDQKLHDSSKSKKIVHPARRHSRSVGVPPTLVPGTAPALRSVGSTSWRPSGAPLRALAGRLEKIRPWAARTSPCRARGAPDGTRGGRAPRDRALPRHFPKVQMREDIGIRSWQHQPPSKPVPGSATATSTWRDGLCPVRRRRGHASA